MTSANARVPNSARIQFRLAEAELEEIALNSQRLADAQAHARRAVDLSPWDYRHWRLLAATQEADNKSEDALNALQVAVKLAPNYSEANWMLANLMLRQNKLSESLVAFRSATSANPVLLPLAFDLLWQASNSDIKVLETLAGVDPRARLALAQFLAEQAQTDAAIGIFRGVDVQTKLNSGSASSFISLMIQAQRYAEARQLWLDIVSASAGRTLGNLIWNGSFEAVAPKEFGHFDWMISHSNYARISFDRSLAREGSKALKLVFAGRDTTKLEGEIKQLVALKPGSRYRLECYAKAANLVTPEGPRLALIGPKGAIAVSDSVAAGSTDWQHLVIDLTAPADAVTMHVAVVRIPRFSYDDPTRGTVWFDDFKLTEQ